LNIGGKVLLMEKVYPDNKKEGKKLLNIQLKRYGYLPDDLADEIINHEKQDFLEDYRMDESKTLSLLRGIGFKKIKILDRVDRDILLVAEK
jgi:hypothetical protein